MKLIIPCKLLLSNNIVSHEFTIHEYTEPVGST